MMNETALICGRFLSPLCKVVKMHVILFFNKTRTRRGGGGGGKERKGGRCVCVFASAMFVNAIPKANIHFYKDMHQK